MSETSGIFTFGEFGNPELEARGNEAIPSTFGEAMSAQFGAGFAANPGTRAARFAWTHLLPNSVLELPPDELNARFGVPGRLTFDQPTTERAARDLQEHHLANARREDAIRRRGNAIGGGTGAAILTGLAAGILDPLNVAAAFIPVIGEARLAEMMGSAARGATGRMMVRGAQGAAGGFVGGLAVEPMNWALTVYDRDDYTMGTFLANIAAGTVLGSAINAGAGAVRDRFRGLPPWSPEMHDAARTQAIAALVEGRPVQAAQAMDFVAARDAQVELRQWYEAQTKQADAVDAATRQAATREDVARTAAQRLADLQAEARRLQFELDDAHARLEAYGIEPATRERLDEIDAELGRAIPKKRRADLERERMMLTEGQDWESQASASGDLEAGRTEAEIAGLERAQQRAQAQLNLAEANLRRRQQMQEAAATTLEQRQAAWAARRDLVRDMAAKTLRGVAWKIGAEFDPADIDRAAMRIMRATPDTLDAAIQRELKALLDRVPAMGPFKPGVVLRDVEPTRSGRFEQAMQNLERNFTRAGDDMASGLDNSRQSEPSADTRTNDAEIARAPKVEGTVDEMLTEIDKANAEIEARLRAETASEKPFTIQRKAGGDETAFFNGLQARVAAALAAESKVVLHVEGKDIPIVKMTNGMMTDAKGQRWGAASLTGEGSRIEVTPKESTLAAEIKEANAIREEGEQMAKAYEAAAVCAVRG